MNKTCSQCKEEKSTWDFHLRSRSNDGLAAECKDCTKETKRKYRDKPGVRKKIRKYRALPENKAKQTALNKKAWAAPEKRDMHKEASWKFHGINMTMDIYNQMFAEQHGCCAICGTHQTELKRKLAVDHDHETGEIRGLLCGKCNVALGGCGDNLESVMRFVEYLK